MVTLMEVAMYKPESGGLFTLNDVISYKRVLTKRQKDRTRRALARVQRDHEARLSKMDREARLRVELRREAIRNTMTYTGTVRPIPGR